MKTLYVEILYVNGEHPLFGKVAWLAMLFLRTDLSVD